MEILGTPLEEALLFVSVIEKVCFSKYVGMSVSSLGHYYMSLKEVFVKKDLYCTYIDRFINTSEISVTNKILFAFTPVNKYVNIYLP